MAKRPNPEKLIKNRARKLALHKCVVNADWQENRKASVMVVRQHTNGNYTICSYLVDLMCLGVKDTFYKFNVSEFEYTDVLQEFLDVGGIEIDYDLAHNIIFAGYEFALNCGIKPHKDFEKVTKFMLEKDDENVPLIDVECGENGVPHYIQTESENATFAGKIIRKLEKNVGEGNFMVTYYSELKEEILKDLDNSDDDDDLLKGMEDDGFDDFEDHDDLWGYLEEDDLDIEQVAFQFLEYFRMEELSEEDNMKFEVCYYVLMKHYTDNKRIEELIDIWETDMKVSPSFEYEQGLSEKINQKIDVINQNPDPELSQKNINFVKENLSNQALADFIILNATSPELDPGDPEFEGEKHKEFEERRKNLAKKYPDFPLFKLYSVRDDIKKEDLTIEKLFGEDYVFSTHELNEYIYLKFNVIVHRGDLNALIAFDTIIENAAIHEDYYNVIKGSYDTFQNVMMFYKIAEDFGEGLKM